MCSYTIDSCKDQTFGHEYKHTNVHIYSFYINVCKQIHDCEVKLYELWILYHVQPIGHPPKQVFTTAS